MWSQTKLILVTCILTALIWTFADQADRREATVPVQLRLVADPGSELKPEITDPASGRIDVRVRGTNKALQRLGINVIEVEWRLPPDAPLGRSVQDLQPVLASAREMAGVTVTKVHPGQAEIYVDRYLAHELPVRLQEGAYLFSGEPRVDPSSANVRMLESDWDTLPVEFRQLTVPLDNYLRNRPQGELLSFDAMLPAQIAGHPISVEPVSVNVKLTLREQTSQRKIAPVVVKFAVATELWNAYQPELKDPSMQRLEIVVVGSPDALAQLTPQDVLGIIDVTSDDVSLEGDFRLKRPVFILPPGIRLQSEAPRVEFRLRPSDQ